MLDDPNGEAYERLAPQLAALARVRVPRYTLDATHAVIQAMAIVRRLEGFRADLARLPDFDPGHVDRLDELAKALTHVHVRIEVFSNKVDLSVLAAEARETRALWMTYLDVLVLNRTVGAEVAKRLRRKAGYLDLSSDLTTLSVFFHERPATLGPGAPITLEQVMRGYEVSQALGMAAVGRGPDTERQQLLQDRARIAHLMVVAQGQLRRAMDFLRYKEGDAARLVPSLYLPRGKGKRRKAEAGTP